MKTAILALWQSARPPFLLLTPVMILLAWAIAQLDGYPQPDALLIGVVFLSAFSAALASNWLNEHFDAQSGLDQQTQQTPFSGGSKALIHAPQHRELVKWAGLLAVSVSVWSGLYLVAEIGIPLLVLGIVGSALVIGYTPIINRFPLVCLLAPGLGYGLVMYLGSYWVFTDVAMSAGIWVLPIPLFLVSALLLLNQFPDALVDANFGRKHWVIAFGKPLAMKTFLVLHVLSFVWLVGLLGLGVLPVGGGLGLLASVGSLWLWWMARHIDPEQLPLNMMGVNVAVVLGMPLLIALGVLW